MKVAPSTSFQSLCVLVRAGSAVGIAMLVPMWILIVGSFLVMGWGTLALGFTEVSAEDPLLMRLLGVLFLTMLIAVLIFFLRICSRLFALYEEGTFFDPRITVIYRWISWGAWGVWLVAVVVVPFVIWVKSGRIDLDFHLGLLLAPIWLHLLSRVMAEGERMQSELELTV